MVDEMGFIIMKLTAKKAISMIEIAFAGFVIFFIYTFVVRQMISDLKFSDLRRSAATTYNVMESASRDIIKSGGYSNRIRNEQDIVKLFAQELVVEKVCEDAKKDGCWSSNWVWSDPKLPGIKLESGQYIVPEFTSATCMSSLNIPNTCGALYIDTNGSNAPNLVGHDMIKMYITSRGLVAAGVKADIMNPAKSCDMVKKFSWGCSARLLGTK